MPRTRKTDLVSSSSSISKVKKTKKTVAPKQSSKKIAPVKKPKKVIVDVIEDDDIVDKNNYFSDDSLANSTYSKLRIEKEEEVEEGNEGDYEINRNDNDIQKKFFSELVSEIETKNDDKKSAQVDKRNQPPRKSLGLYRRLVWKFLIMVGILALIVFYFSFSKLTILITPEVEKMSDTLFLKVSNESLDEIDLREKVTGSVNEFDVAVEKQYDATGEETTSVDLQGKVTIINNYIKAQPLVAKTRLQSSDNKIYRIKEAVNVPAGGKVEVEIYSETPSDAMAIAPSHFTIPGLWAGLQDKIYAESSEAFVYGEIIQKYIKPQDIQFANKDIDELILKKAKENKPLRSQDEVIYQVLDSSETKIDVKAGDKVDSFTVIGKAKVVAVTFSKEEVARLASGKLNILVPDDKELSEFKQESLSFNLENYDEKNKVATVKASFWGFMVLKKNADIINKERLVNLNEQQISAYLNDYPEIGNYELKFYPNFVKKAPNLVDRIDIRIKK